MANIRVDVDHIITDGCQIKFRSPVDCSAVTGLIVYYPGADGLTTSTVFAFADAHGNNVGDIDHLFAENVVVNIILDVTSGMAFVQNADTNKYIEENFLKKSNANGDWSVDMAGHRITGLPIPQSGSEPATKEFVESFTVEGSTYVATDDNKDGNIVLRPYVADADELEFRDHIKNKENPHGVTPAQIGALPVSDGELNNDTNFDKIEKDIISWVNPWVGNNTGVHVPPTAGFIHAFWHNGQEVQKFYGTNGAMLYRTKGGDWVNISPSAFAPAGYGLGTHLATRTTNVNSADASGWYLIEPNATNSPNGTYYAVVRTDSLDGNSIVQTAWVLDSYFSKLVRRKSFGTWGEWEWENPPMIPGKVYRTTKRHGGKPIYTYCISANIGLEDAGGYITRWFNHLEAAASMVDIISVKAKVHPIGSNSNQVLPAIGSDGITSINAFNTGFSIYSTKATNVDYIYAEFEFTME